MTSNNIFLQKFLLVFFLALGTGTMIGSDISGAEKDKYIEMVKGQPSAPVTFIEYASLTCSYCAEFHRTVFPKLNEDYIKKGLVKYIHREIYFDRAGLWAALTARCTKNASSYFGMLDMLYLEQSSWARFDKSDDIVKGLLRISAKSGIGKEKALLCLEDEEKALDLVKQYQIYAKKDSIESTPTFMINGKKFSNQSYVELRKIIDEELKN